MDVAKRSADHNRRERELELIHLAVFTRWSFLRSASVIHLQKVARNPLHRRHSIPPSDHE